MGGFHPGGFRPGETAAIVRSEVKWLWNRVRRQATFERLEAIPEHESAVRRMVADGHGGSYEAFRSLADARKREGTAVVMEGDYGGSIYLTCPASLVRCDEAKLRQLLLDLDEHDWNDPDGAGLYYEYAPVGSGIAGGTGGGAVTDRIWLHPELEAKGLRAAVEAVVLAERERIN